MEKIFNQHTDKFFLYRSLLIVSSLILFPLFATGVVDNGGKFAAVVVDTGRNLPPALMTRWPICRWYP
jgi:hypothetical protein